MKKYIAVLCIILITMTLILTSCGANPSGSSSSEILNKEQTTSSVVLDVDNKTVTTPMTVTEESPSQSNTSLPSPPSNMALTDLNYWSKADSFRVLHTQSPPFKAVTLKKGTEEYDTLLSLLRQVDGTYLNISQEGLSGGFMPIYVYQGTTELDRISINIAGDARFSTDTQQEDSRQGLVNKYASLYAMSEELSEKIRYFLETLEYTEDI